MINASHEVSWHSAESITRSIQMQIVDALRLGERSKASNQLLNLGRGNDLLRADDFVYILNYRAESPDPLCLIEFTCVLAEIMRVSAFELLIFVPDYGNVKSVKGKPSKLCIDTFCAMDMFISFVMETWRIMDEKEISLNNICSLLMVHALCKGGYLEEAFKLINFLGESPGIYPVLPIYNSFLRACAKMQSIINANQCLDLMERQMVGMGKNEVTYSELLKDDHAVNADQCTTFGLGVGEENVGMDMLDIHISQPVTKILRWSFSDVIHPCARLRNGGLAEELILQLRIMQQRNLKLYDSTLANLSVGCSKVLELDFSCVSAGSNI
ncbi:PREDICTED: pentatricopeptide repeat-containing [Prunus dulcis]|uniref:PREDICTED: pentatricopeptide repeat-containing n=1 Tax=Prunus dulcis TaxID=3755 RepID=A0A5E4G3T2_PRUDU|nr:PREDICTED: pentatricopeptide repeat-containing [Prunus dulcis]